MVTEATLERARGGDDRAFGEFQAGVRDRCEEPPVQHAFTEVGSYRFFT